MTVFHSLPDVCSVSVSFTARPFVFTGEQANYRSPIALFLVSVCENSVSGSETAMVRSGVGIQRRYDVGLYSRKCIFSYCHLCSVPASLLAFLVL